MKNIDCEISAMKISVVIPVFKSSQSLFKIAEELQTLGEDSLYQFEIIFVNDSPFWPETVCALEELKSAYPEIIVLQLRRNQGQHLALLVGLKHASGEFVVTMDDDLQHPISEIPKLVNAISGDSRLDAVFAVPKYKEKKHTLWRNVGSYVLNKIDVWFLRKPEGLIKSAYKIMRLDIAKILVEHHNAMPSISSLILNETQNVINIKVRHDVRAYGKGNYTLSKLINLSFNNIIHYSSLPLRFLGMIGIAGFMLSLLYMIAVLVQRVFLGTSVPGYASIVLLISFFGGLNLLGFGIVGEYLLRIIREQQKPDLESLIKL